MDLVTILLAVYNAEKHLEELLLSLIKQDYPFIKIIVRDNYSSDRTPAILEKWQKLYPHKLQFHRGKENIGIIGNFSCLLSTAPKSSYLMFCDGDDIWFSSKTSKTLAKMKECERKHGTSYPLLIHTDLVVTDENLNVIAPSFWKLSKLNTSKSCHKLERLLVQNHVTGCTMLINGALRELVDPIPAECVMHDWWIALVAASLGKVESLSESTLYYRQHSSNDTGAKPYGIHPFLRKKNTQKLPSKKMKQAELLLKRFQDRISPSNKKLLLTYLKMQRVNALYKFILIARFNFWKSGMLRNFILNH